MKLAVVFALLVACVAIQAISIGLDDMVLDESVIQRVNSDPKSTWKAGRNSRFEGMTLRQAKQLVGVKLGPKEKNTVDTAGANDIPESFDSRTQWPDCIHEIRDQKHCGSCWAFSLTEVVSDRFCIASQGAVNTILAPQYVLSCDKADECCNGGYIDRSWNFMVTTGTVADTCWPYESDTGACPACRTTCKDGSPLSTLYKVKQGTVKHIGGVPAIQTAIMTSGPVEVGFMVYYDFFSYKTGVYKHTSSYFMGGHAVKMLGWGVENGTPYWLCANSWGTSWGELGGFFKILRGKDECDIEDYVYAGDPAL